MNTVVREPCRSRARIVYLALHQNHSEQPGIATVKQNKPPSGLPWLSELEGKTVQGHVLETRLGAGKIGVVYLASRSELPSHKVAIKLIANPRTGWETELTKVSKLSGVTGVVQLLAFDACLLEADGGSKVPVLFTSWNYIPGSNLKLYLASHAKVSVSFVVAVVDRILRVLHACKERGVVRHGDLHSGNVLIADPDPAEPDIDLVARERIYVADFGYGATGGGATPKDDYRGLATIFAEMLAHVDQVTTTRADKYVLRTLSKVLGEQAAMENVSKRLSAFELLKALGEARNHGSFLGDSAPASAAGTSGPVPPKPMSVGDYQIAEMLGTAYERWKQLFVSNVPGRDRILAAGKHTVITGPRGCGKTMLLRRLSERLILECGPVDGVTERSSSVALYVNANDIADAFAAFPENPTPADHGKLVAYLNLCVLADILAVQAVRRGKFDEAPSGEMVALLGLWFDRGDADRQPVAGEDLIAHYRQRIDELKWEFTDRVNVPSFSGYSKMAQLRWLAEMIRLLRSTCPWLGDKPVLLFVDDYTTPRVSTAMQHVLNRAILQRSPEFVTKVATEAATTFVASDSSGKLLQDGDDFELIDMGEESLFMKESERLAFLEEVFRRRLELDGRIPSDAASLRSVLAMSGLSKTEFARRLRGDRSSGPDSETSTIRRGASKARVLYHGADIFSSTWSGDTRMMIQVLTEVLDQAPRLGTSSTPSLPVDAEVQDKVLRSRGGEWLDSQARNHPSDPMAVDRGLIALESAGVQFAYTGGSYGSHLKAIVEAFAVAAEALLMGPTYILREQGRVREVPRMAFRIEILDTLRLGLLATELYRDLVRYGLFMRDARGKSVRGALVPRLYLRRLLLPIFTLPVSKRDSVQLTNAQFEALLVTPDAFRMRRSVRRSAVHDTAQLQLLESTSGTPSDTNEVQTPDEYWEAEDD